MYDAFNTGKALKSLVSELSDREKIVYFAV